MKRKYALKRDTVDQRDHKFSRTFFPHGEVVLPPSVDLRPQCPSVYDQGELGSCTANAGCTCRAMLLEGEELSLSRMFLYYAERALEENTQKDSGASLRDACKAIFRWGICEEKYMPYDVSKYKAPPSKIALRSAAKYKINAYKSLENLDEIRQNLAFRQQPVMMGMDVYESFESEMTAKTGILSMPHTGEKNLGGHAVLVVGYRDVDQKGGWKKKSAVPQGYLIMRNSWGSSWGQEGYFYMPYAYVSQGYTYDYWMMED